MTFKKIFFPLELITKKIFPREFPVNSTFRFAKHLKCLSFGTLVTNHVFSYFKIKSWAVPVLVGESKASKQTNKQMTSSEFHPWKREGWIHGKPATLDLDISSQETVEELWELVWEGETICSRWCFQLGVSGQEPVVCFLCVLLTYCHLTASEGLSKVSILKSGWPCVYVVITFSASKMDEGTLY